VDRGEIDHRFDAGEPAYNRADHAAMRHDQGASVVAMCRLLPGQEHPLESILHPCRKPGPALSARVGPVGRQAVSGPTLELGGMAHADLVGGQSLEQAEVDLDKL